MTNEGYDWIVTDGVTSEEGWAPTIEGAELEAQESLWRLAEKSAGFRYEIFEVAHRKVAGSEEATPDALAKIRALVDPLGYSSCYSDDPNYKHLQLARKILKILDQEAQ